MSIGRHPTYEARLLWSYTTGRKGLNRVRVYERTENGPLQIEWWDRSGRHRETLRNMAGASLLDRDLARDIADAVSTGQRKKREAVAAHELLGKPQPRTFRELTKAYHDAKASGWSYHHKRVQSQLRDFWLAVLGDDVLTAVTPDRVSRAVEVRARASKWTPRTRQKYLRYIVDAFSYAQHKLKWITESANLSAVDMPRPAGESRAYALEEVRKLLKNAGAVDMRAHALLWLAWTTGRRLHAIRTLKASAVEIEGQRTVIQFPGSTDKARRSGRAYLGAQARATIARLCVSPAVQASGLLFPAGDLNEPRAKRRALTDSECRELLRAVEQAAGVETKRGRAYHGIKRRFASAADPAAASRQSGTTRETLERIYRQDDPGPKIELADRLEQLIGTATVTLTGTAKRKKAAK